MTDTAGTVALIAITFYATHMVADHWVQTDHQATRKPDRGWSGRRACAAHVVVLTIMLAASLAALAIVVHVDVSWKRSLVGLVINSISHYVADRRTPIYAIAKLIGKSQMILLGAPRQGRDDNPSLGTGLYALDQSWHVWWLLVTSVVVGGC